MLFNLQVSTMENRMAAVSAPFLECVPYQVFLPMTGFLRSRSCRLLSIGNAGSRKNLVSPSKFLVKYSYFPSGVFSLRTSVARSKSL